MLAVTVKTLSILSLPLLVTAYWKLRSRSSWRCLLAALAAFATGQFVFDNIVSLYIFDFPPTLSYYFVGLTLTYIALRFGLWWTILRVPAARINTWKDALLFSHTYTALTATYNLSRRIQRSFTYEIETFKAANCFPDSPNCDSLSILLNMLPQKRLDIIAQTLAGGDLYNFTLDNAITPLLINGATAIAVLYCIKTRQIWPAVAATLCLLLPAIADSPAAMHEIQFAILRPILGNPTINDSLNTLTDALRDMGFKNANLLPAYIAIALPILTTIPALAFARSLKKRPHKPRRTPNNAHQVAKSKPKRQKPPHTRRLIGIGEAPFQCYTAETIKNQKVPHRPETRERP